MSETSRQLILDLDHTPRFGRDDFLVSPSNEAAYALIERWPDWPDAVLILQGPKGSGKSHLAAIFAEKADATTIEARAIDADTVPKLIEADTLVIENADRLPRDEAALFHLLNRLREQHGFVLITTQSSAESWQLTKPDLLSRLRLAPVARLDPPDDSLLKAVLVKLFLDRQLVVDTSVVDYLSLRLERHLSQAQDVVAFLDREALSRGRRITRAIAAEYFQFEGKATE